MEQGLEPALHPMEMGPGAFGLAEQALRSILRLLGHLE